MSKWFRWYAGTVEDGKFRYVARNANVTLPTVIALWVALLEDASHDDHRGIVTRNEDFFAAILDLEDGVAEQILQAMEDVKMISVGMGAITIINWNERQFESDKEDGTNAERQRRYRNRKKSNGTVTEVTPLRNGSVTAQSTDTDTDTDTEVVQSRASAPPAAAPPERFIDRMIEAAGDCLANPCNAQGLLTEATPVMWIENGCDLERDILPTLRAAAVTRKGKRIATWAYFTGMVAEAKAKRLAGLPVVEVRKPKEAIFKPSPRRRELTDAEKFEQNLPWLKEMGIIDEHAS